MVNLGSTVSILHVQIRLQPVTAYVIALTYEVYGGFTLKMHLNPLISPGRGQFRQGIEPFGQSFYTTCRLHLPGEENM